MVRAFWQYGDTSELRDHAQRMTDARLTDRKKQIGILLTYSLAQSDLANVLRVQRQVVSKARFVPRVLLAIAHLPGYSAEFLLSRGERR